MRRLLATTAALACFTLLAGCACSTCADDGASDSRSAQAIVDEAHGRYVTAINTNDVDKIMAVMTDDVVFLPPNGPRMVGKDTIRPWVAGYVEAFDSRWKKTTLESVAFGDWAFEQYSYESADTPKGGGETMRDVGKGLIIYHRDNDGVWRVARDAWNSDLPAGGH